MTAYCWSVTKKTAYGIPKRRNKWLLKYMVFQDGYADLRLKGGCFFTVGSRPNTYQLAVALWNYSLDDFRHRTLHSRYLFILLYLMF